MLCRVCSVQEHEGEGHNILTLDQLSEEIQDSEYDKRAPDIFRSHAKIVKDAHMKCLAGIEKC